MDTNILYYADNLEVMRTLPGESIDLIYIDPPFYTEQERTNNSHKEGDPTYYDRYGDTLDEHLTFMKIRLKEMHRLLKESGSILVHLDDRTVFETKLLMDTIFKRKNFLNNIIWRYTNWITRKASGLENRHNNILYYAKDRSKKIFNAVLEPYTLFELRALHKTHFDENGEYYCVRFRPNRPRYKRYLKDVMEKGKIQHDVWTIHLIGSTAKERVGYPTQKPLKLLERIIKMASNQGGIVADFFCGSGTTISAAEKLGRQWIGVDASKQAIDIIKKRMLKERGVVIDVKELDRITLKELYNLTENEVSKQVILALHGVSYTSKGLIKGVISETGEQIIVKNKIINPEDIDETTKSIVVGRSFTKDAIELIEKLNYKHFTFSEIFK